MVRVLSTVWVLFLVLLITACGPKGGDAAGGPRPDPLPAKPTPRPEDPPVVLDPLPRYKPVTSVFSDPLEVVRNPDTAATLLKLRQIASPTVEYHTDLFNIAKAVRTLDLAHLMVLIDACYYSSQDVEAMREELKGVQGRSDYESRVKRARINRDLGLVAQLTLYINRIISTGFSKTTDLDFDGSFAVLERLFVGYDAGPLFETVVRKFSPLSVDRKLKLMDLASAKGAHRTAASLAFDWFQNHSDRSYPTLLALAGRLKFESKDYLLLDAMAIFSKFTLEQVIELAHAADAMEGEVAAAAYAKAGPHSHGNVLHVANALKENSRGPFFSGAIVLCDALTVNQLNELLDLAKSLRNEIAAKAVAKISDLTPVRAAEVSSRLEYDGKDVWLKGALNKIRNLSTDELVTMMAASYEDRSELAMLALNKVSDLGHGNALKVAGQLKYDSKDTWLREFLAKKVERLTTDELISIMRASYDAKAEFAMAAFDKISDLNFEGGLRVAAELKYDAKDTWLKAVIDKKIKSISTAELLVLMEASYDSRTAFAMAAFGKLSDFGFENALKVAAELRYDAKDTWLRACLKKFDRLTTAELITLMKAAYEAKVEFAKGSLQKVSDLTHANALLVAAELRYNDKDSWLQMVLARFQKLTTAELIAYMQAAYESKSAFAMDSLKKLTDLTPANALLVAAELRYSEKDNWLLAAYSRFQILAAGDLREAMEAAYEATEQLSLKFLDRVSDLTVANAVSLVEVLRYDAKDKFLLKAVDLVTNLTKANLESLVAAGYDSKEQIRAKGLKRLGSGLRLR